MRPLLPILYAFTIFLSAFLLFVLEPLVAKQILPWFGGSAAVWSTCLVFFQTVLLAGYFYSTRIVRLASTRAQVLVHVGILAVSLGFLPIGARSWPGNAAHAHPAWVILELLAVSIAIPFLALSATSPLLQHWLGSSGHRTPHKLFAVSNFASLAALISYPLLIEPKLDMSAQRTVWSACYALFAMTCSLCAVLTPASKRFHMQQEITSDPEVEFIASRKVLCVLLAACGSMLLLALTNHLTENVAPVPLLWVLPLSLYLLTFVLVFSTDGIYRRAFWLRFLAVGLGVVGYEIYDINTVEAIQVSIPVCLAGLFLCCMFCHGELNRLRPAANELPVFYLLMAAGGAAGAVFVALLSPVLFTGIYELPVALIFTAMLAAVVVWPERNWAARVLWIGISIAGCMLLYVNVSSYEKNTLSVRRSFYGSLRVVQSPLAGDRQTRTLYHGTIEHGAQFLLPPMRFRPTTYYGPDSGVGILLRECVASAARIGVVGLGAGTVAAYGRSGDQYVFYEINSQVEDIATSLFFYLRESKARTNIVIGDARLSLQAENGPPFDVLVLDAFSGDAIPVHLITREALRLYFKRLNPDGALAFHVSNNYLDLASVVAQLATEAGYGALLAHNHEDDENLTLPADWVIVTRNQSILENASLKAHATPIAARAGLRPWTDNYNNLLQILRTPAVQ